MTEAECPTQLQVRLASIPDSVPTVRHLVSDVIPEPEPALAEIARLLVSELVANSVTHGTPTRRSQSSSTWCWTATCSMSR